MKHLTLLTFFIFLFCVSCSKGTEEKQLLLNKGEYLITSLVSDIPLDLNYDNVKSTNLLEELVPYFYPRADPTWYDLYIQEYRFENSHMIIYNSPPRDAYHPDHSFYEQRFRYGPNDVFLEVTNNQVTNINFGIYNEFQLLHEEFSPVPLEVIFIDKDNIKIKFKQLWYDLDINERILVHSEATYVRK